MLQRHLKRWLERTETVRVGSREKAGQAKEKMEELRGVHRRLTEERAEKGRDMERRRVRIEQTEKMVSANHLLHVRKLMRRGYMLMWM